jgi:hypothetical protein
MSFGLTFTLPCKYLHILQHPCWYTTYNFFSPALMYSYTLFWRFLGCGFRITLIKVLHSLQRLFLVGYIMWMYWCKRWSRTTRQSANCVAFNVTQRIITATHDSQYKFRCFSSGHVSAQLVYMFVEVTGTVLWSLIVSQDFVRYVVRIKWKVVTSPSRVLRKHTAAQLDKIFHPVRGDWRFLILVSSFPRPQNWGRRIQSTSCFFQNHFNIIFIFKLSIRSGLVP